MPASSYTLREKMDLFSRKICGNQPEHAGCREYVVIAMGEKPSSAESDEGPGRCRVPSPGDEGTKGRGSSSLIRCAPAAGSAWFIRTARMRRIRQNSSKSTNRVRRDEERRRTYQRSSKQVNGSKNADAFFSSPILRIGLPRERQSILNDFSRTGNNQSLCPKRSWSVLLCEHERSPASELPDPPWSAVQKNALSFLNPVPSGCRVLPRVSCYTYKRQRRRQ